MKRKSQNPAIPLVRARDRAPLAFCKTCNRRTPYRFSRCKERKVGHRVFITTIYVCQECGTEVL